MLFDRRYLFQGSAVGAAAHIRRFKDQPVTMPACFEGSAALPLTGGCSESVSKPVEMGHPEHGFVLSFDSASGSVSGDFTDVQLAIEQTHGRHPQHRVPVRIAAGAAVTKLNIQNRLLVETIEAHLVSEDSRNGGQTRFGSLKPQVLAGVRIDGHALKVELDDVFLQAATKGALIEEYEHDARFRETYKDRFYRAGKDEGFHGSHDIPEIKGYIVASIVKRISFADGMPLGASIEGNRITLPNFGKIYFGEIFIGDNDRSLTMLRLQLGSDWGGDGSFGYSKPGGGADAP